MCIKVGVKTANKCRPGKDRAKQKARRGNPANKALGNLSRQIAAAATTSAVRKSIRTIPGPQLCDCGRRVGKKNSRRLNKYLRHHNVISSREARSALLLSPHSVIVRRSQTRREREKQEESETLRRARVQVKSKT